MAKQTAPRQTAPWQTQPSKRRATRSQGEEGPTGDAVLDAQQAPGGGNQAAIAAMHDAPAGGQAAPAGPMVRVFNRIRGQAETRDVTQSAFDRAQLRRYLDQTLQFARDEWFRGKKLDGVADKLMEQLDTDGNGAVGWTEFAAFEAQTLEALTGRLAPGATNAQIAAAAKAQHAGVDGNGDGSASFGEIQSSTRGQLPPGTEHADLIAQLAARIALDAVDTDQRTTRPEDRSLSASEWVSAAQQMAESQRGG